MSQVGLIAWLARHSAVTVVASLAVFALLGISVAAWFRAPEGAAPTARGPSVAVSVLPDPSSSPPGARVGRAHRALHALDRVCEASPPKRRTKAVRQHVRVIERFAADYPNGGFMMDHESGTTLALLIVVRYELQGCAPSLVSRVDALLPEQYRGE